MPGAKFAVECGEQEAWFVIETLQYLGHLTEPHSLEAFGIDKRIRPMDIATGLYVRDHPVYSNVRKHSDRGMTHQYGHVLLEGGHAPETLVATASAIALAQENEVGEILITRKKQLGLKDEHGKDLIPKFHSIGEDGSKVEMDRKEDPDGAPIKEAKEHLSKTPPLKQDETPPLKDEGSGGAVDRKKRRLPWIRYRS